MNGNGMLVTGNGVEFTGGFFNNLKNGHAQIKYPDGRVFTEQWENGTLK